MIVAHSSKDQIYASSLDVSANQWLEQVTTDIPFFAVGVVSLACFTCLLLTQRLSIPASCVLTSAFFAFNGAIFDFARLLQVAKGTNSNPANSGPLGIVILRDISFALSVSLNYLFFLVYLGRPPRGEVKLVALADQARARRESPSRWLYWGLFGLLAQGVLGSSILAVALLEVIWRVTGKANHSKIYIADGILQGILSITFLGKIVLNTYLSPLIPRWKTLRDYSPLIFALSTRLGIALTSEFSVGFSECSLGRLLQATQLYVLIVLLLISPFYGAKDQSVDMTEDRRASSFRGLRFSNTSRWSALNANPSNQVEEGQPPRGSPSQRFSWWLNNRLETKRESQEDRLWNKDKPDLEVPPTPADRNADDNDPSPIGSRFEEKLPKATWQGPYLPDPISPASTNDNTTPSNPAQIVKIAARVNPNVFPVPKASPAPTGSGTLAGSQSTLAKFAGRVEFNESHESDSDTPIYGINGIIQKKAKRDERKAASKFAEDRANAIYQLEKEKEKLERSVARMSVSAPSTSDFSRRTTDQLHPDSASALLAARLLNGGFSESGRSDFSLGDFPSPPESTFGNAKTNISNTRTQATFVTNSVSTRSSDALERQVTQVVEDVQFAMVPPRMPAAYQGRRASFPAMARESTTSSMDGMARIISTYADSEDDVGGKRVRMSSADNRLDVTSFIGELTTPQIGRLFGPGRDSGRPLYDAIDARLSPLAEDLSPRPSVEIIDMRLKSPTFIPAIAISTNDTARINAATGRKVSFAPVTYEPSSRPRVKATPILPNILLASPRLSPSPTGSPTTASRFKPVTSSPLANISEDATTSRAKGTYPGLPGSSRPFISSPMPLRNSGEQGYQSPRRAPNPSRTQRFL